jgi:hypothetical protein
MVRVGPDGTNAALAGRTRVCEFTDKVRSSIANNNRRNTRCQATRTDPGAPSSTPTQESRSDTIEGKADKAVGPSRPFIRIVYKHGGVATWSSCSPTQ